MARSKKEEEDRRTIEERIQSAALQEGFSLERRASIALSQVGFAAELGVTYFDLEESESGSHSWRDCDVTAAPNDPVLQQPAAHLKIFAECKHVFENQPWVFVVDPIPTTCSEPPFIATSDNERLGCEPPISIEESTPMFAGHPHFDVNLRSRQYFVLGPSDSADKKGRNDVREALLQSLKPAWHAMYLRIVRRTAFRLFCLSYVVVSRPIAIVRYKTDALPSVTFSERVLVSIDRPVARHPSLMQDASDRGFRERWLLRHRRSLVEVVTIEGLRASATAALEWYRRLPRALAAP